MTGVARNFSGVGGNFAGVARNLNGIGGDLYEAMGCVRKSKRASGLTKKKNAPLAAGK